MEFQVISEKYKKDNFLQISLSLIKGVRYQ